VGIAVRQRSHGCRGCAHRRRQGRRRRPSVSG
jgi:hypothetical protein